MPSEQLMAEINAAIDERASEGADQAGSEERRVGIVDSDPQPSKEQAKQEEEENPIDPGSKAIVPDDGKLGDAGGQSSDDDQSDGDPGDSSAGRQDTAVDDSGPEVSLAESEAISDEVLTEAVRAGISIADAREFPSESVLKNVISAIAGEKDEDGTEKKDPFADIPDLDPEEHGEEVAGAFAKLKEVAKQQQAYIQNIDAGQRKMDMMAREVAARDVAEEFNSMVSDLGEEYKEALGDGPTELLPEGSAQYARRDELAGQMALLINGYKASGQKMPSKSKLFRMAVNHVLPEVVLASRGREITKKLEEREEEQISRTSGASARKSKSPEDEVAEMLDKQYFGK